MTNFLKPKEFEALLLFVLYTIFNSTGITSEIIANYNS